MVTVAVIGEGERSLRIEVLNDVRCRLAEGPVWDVGEQALYWCDLLAGGVWRYDWRSGTTRDWILPGGMLGSLAVREGGNLMLAMGSAFCLFDPETGVLQEIAAPLAGTAHARFNDGKIDREGRFVAGGVHGVAGSGIGPEPICGAFQLSADRGVRPLADGFACFNGPCFSPDGQTLYVTGRGGMTGIEAMAYDSASGEVGDACVLIDGIDPDGATVDAEGFIWSAQWAAGCVLRVSPEGEIAHRIELPGHVVSSVMFGGPDLDILFVTTLGEPYWGAEPQAPDAGAVLTIRGLGVRGLAERRYAG